MLFVRSITIAFVLSLFSYLYASSPETVPPDADAKARAFVNQKLDAWQAQMNLTDWHIRVDLARIDQLEPRTLGKVHWDTESRTAEIAVLAPEFYNLPFAAMLDDMEVTIVHELVHIKLASLPHTDGSKPVEEHAVHDITAALLNLERGHRAESSGND